MLALTGLGLPGLFRGAGGRGTAQAGLPAASGFGRARSCILIFQWGGPSQLDTWDPKPDAPAEIRGEFAHDRDERRRASGSASTSRCSPRRRTGWRSSGR